MVCVFFFVFDFFGVGGVLDVEIYGDLGVNMLGYIVEFCV